MISIVVSIYNGESYLERCIKSLIIQPTDKCEIILVDDGSTDLSGTICDFYASKYNNITVIHKENGGLSSARLSGFNIVKGEYVIFIDCDDYVSDDLVMKLEYQIKQNHADMVLFDYYTVKQSGEKNIKTIDLPEELLEKYNPEKYAIGSIADGWNNDTQKYIKGFLWLRCIKKAVLSNDMFISERECYTEDVLFNLALSFRIKSVDYIKMPLYYYCINENSLTMSYRENMWKMLQFRQNWIEQFCKKQSIINQACQRFERSYWSSIMIAFDNSANQKDFVLVKQQMQEIRESEDVKKMICIVRKKIFSLSFNEVIKFVLISLKQYRLYWKIKNL